MVSKLRGPATSGEIRGGMARSRARAVTWRTCTCWLCTFHNLRHPPCMPSATHSPSRRRRLSPMRIPDIASPQWWGPVQRQGVVVSDLAPPHQVVDQVHAACRVFQLEEPRRVGKRLWFLQEGKQLAAVSLGRTVPWMAVGGQPLQVVALKPRYAV